MIREDEDRVVAVIGLGYVGLPLAVEFGRRFRTIGFDIDPTRVAELCSGVDRTLEISTEELADSEFLSVTTDEQELDGANYFVITVPTPIDLSKRPDLRPLHAATRLVAQHLKSGDTVIYESTVFPGATEGTCVPLLEAGSGLVLNRDFFVGYSPERINPGDRSHRLTSIVKVTSGSTPEAAEDIDRLYRSIIAAGTHLAPTIQVAEAAKVIENVQRDVNIALINELAVLFAKLDIDTHQVLEAAGTKWNFLHFKPGLVGGHCIGVDPYYLTHRAQEVGHHPDVILAGRRINDAMGDYVAERVVMLMTRKGVDTSRAKVLILGLAFKEDCPDIRNTRVIDIWKSLQQFGIQADIHDPWVNTREALHEYGLSLRSHDELSRGSSYSAVVVAVAHRCFIESPEWIAGLLDSPGVVFDVKGALPPEMVDMRL